MYYNKKFITKYLHSVFCYTIFASSKLLFMINIKKSNYWMLKDFAINRSRRPEVQGIKLMAIYNLIQKNGTEIQSNDVNLKGVKAIEISEGEFIGMKRTGPTSNFYPCAIKTILLTNLKG